jgi:hypothetical protein
VRQVPIILDIRSQIERHRWLRKKRALGEEQRVIVVIFIDIILHFETHFIY